MTLHFTVKGTTITRRQAIKATGETLAGLGCLAALPSLPGNAVEAAPPQTIPATQPNLATNSTEKLRVATCQFPVGPIPQRTRSISADFMHQAAREGAHLLHTSEASLSGYAGMRFPDVREI